MRRHGQALAGVNLVDSRNYGLPNHIGGLFEIDISTCQLQKILLIHVFAAQNTRFPAETACGSSSLPVRISHTYQRLSSARHSRESGNPGTFMIEVDSRFRGNDGLSRNLLPA